MTLDEAIKHAEEVADTKLQDAELSEIQGCYNNAKKCSACAEEHRQLAKWLKELKKLRGQTRWIPVSERLPEDEQEILFSTKTGRVHSGRYYDDGTNQWYSYKDECRAWNNVVTAWMPLPKPCRESGGEE